VLSRTGYVFLLSGVLLNTVIKWWFGYEWLEIIGFGLILLSLLISKNQITEVNENYGVYIYYTLLVLLMILLFVKWFY
jgi:hypothetical protein